VTLAFIEKNLKVKAIKGSLQSLCDAGLVEMTVNFDESLYSITAEGRKQLRLRAK
jgi:predicted transcriptional regulator